MSNQTAWRQARTQHLLDENLLLLLPDELGDWYHAREVCREHGRELLSLHNATDVSRLNYAMQRDGVTAPLWSGLNDIDAEGQWVWSDETRSDSLISLNANLSGVLVGSAGNAPMWTGAVTGGRRVNCAVVLPPQHRHRGRLRHEPCCCTNLFGTACGARLNQPVPAPVPTSARRRRADRGTPHNNDFYLDMSPANWFDARDACLSRGRDLATLQSAHNESSRDFSADLRRLNYLASRYAVQAWVGLYDFRVPSGNAAAAANGTTNATAWLWSNASPIGNSSALPWREGQPVNNSNIALSAPQEHCAFFGFGESDYGLQSGSCFGLVLPFFCGPHLHENSTVPLHNPTAYRNAEFNRAVARGESLNPP